MTVVKGAHEIEERPARIRIAGCVLQGGERPVVECRQIDAALDGAEPRQVGVALLQGLLHGGVVTQPRFAIDVRGLGGEEAQHEDARERSADTFRHVKSLNVHAGFVFHNRSIFAPVERGLYPGSYRMLSFRVTDYPARSTMAPHHHEEHSFVVVPDGVYLERIQGSEVELSAGYMLFRPAFATHSQRFGPGGTRALVINPGPALLEHLRNRGLSLETARCVEAPAISQLTYRAMAEIQRDDTFAALAVEGVLLELIATFARRERRESPAALPCWLRTARDFVREHADENQSMEAIAAITGRHPAHLAKEFRRYFGMTIGGYRRQIRLHRAEGMLLRKNIDLAEIALVCGFANQAHFCRSFKAAFGVTPSRFRSQRGDFRAS
jgi:AraC family transcriptional regulator